MAASNASLALCNAWTWLGATTVIVTPNDPSLVFADTAGPTTQAAPASESVIATSWSSLRWSPSGDSISIVNSDIRQAPPHGLKPPLRSLLTMFLIALWSLFVL